MINRFNIAAVALAAVLGFADARAVVAYDSGSLSFESIGQSMWDTGSAFRKSESVFAGSEWSNKTATIGGIAGSADEIVIPAIGAVTVPVYEPRVFVPTPTWTNPFKGYYTGCACWKDVVVKPATNAVTADTRTGAMLEVHTSGKVGLEFGYAIDSGSVDTSAGFRATAQLPEVVRPSEYFDLRPGSSLDSASIKTQSPRIEAYISSIMKISASIDAQACGLTFGCANSGTKPLASVDLDQRIVSIDPNSVKLLDGVLPGGKAFAEIPILNQSLTLKGGATPVPPVVGFKLEGPFGVTLATSMPPTPAVTADIADMTLQIPNIATQGTGSGDSAKSSGRDDLLSATMDIDGAATLMGGMPPAGVGVDLIDAGPFKLSASFDLADADAGPVLGVTQDFEFMPKLMATIRFSHPVLIADLAGPQDSWTGLWSELPEIALLGTTTFSPTFWLSAMLSNDLGLDLGLVGTLELLKMSATGTVGGIDLLNFNALSLNSLLGIDETLFETSKIGFSVYDTSFELAGFNTLEGTPFTLSPVPEPATLALMLAGLLGLHLRRCGSAGAR